MSTVRCRISEREAQEIRGLSRSALHAIEMAFQLGYERGLQTARDEPSVELAESLLQLRKTAGKMFGE